MSDSSASKALTESLLSVIRQQRHFGVRIVRYLVGTIDLGKHFGPSETHDGGLFGYTDSSYGDDELTKRSHSGYIFIL